MKQNRRLIALILSMFCCFPAMATQVVVTIKPLHSLVSAITEGVLEPELLMQGTASPHAFSMRPSQRLMLEKADAIIYASEALETTFVPLFKSLAEDKLVIESAKLSGIQLRRYESNGHEGHQHHDSHHKHSEQDLWYDPHIWLDPSLMAIFVARITEHLSVLLPQHRKRLRENSAGLLDKLQRLDKTLKTQLDGVKKVPFMTYHDAYGYFTDRYQLSSGGHFSTGHAQSLSAQQLKKIEDKIRDQAIECIFEEPQFKAPLIERVKSLTGVRSAELDPLGQSLSASSSQYFQLMLRLSSAMRACLKPD